MHNCSHCLWLGCHTFHHCLGHTSKYIPSSQKRRFDFQRRQTSTSWFSVRSHRQSILQWSLWYRHQSRDPILASEPGKVVILWERRREHAQRCYRSMGVCFLTFPGKVVAYWQVWTVTKVASTTRSKALAVFHTTPTQSVMWLSIRTGLSMHLLTVGSPPLSRRFRQCWSGWC